MRTFSQLWTAFWRKSVTSSNWCPPGPKTCLKMTVKEPPPLPALRTHLLTAPLLPPPAPPRPAISTWRCSFQRRRRRLRTVRRLPWSRTPYYDGERAGECNVIQHFTSYITQSVSQVLVKTDQGHLKKINSGCTDITGCLEKPWTQ